MVRRVQVLLEDDLDGGAADRTVEFSFDQSRYEIDLNTANIERLAEVLAPFMSKARPAGSRKNGSRGRAARGTNNSPAIREWARSQGMTIAERGRIPAEVVDAWSRTK